MDDKPPGQSNPAIIEVQHQDDDRNSTTSEDHLLGNIEDGNRQKDMTENKEDVNNIETKNDSSPQKTVKELGDNKEIGSEKKNEESESVRTGTEIEIEMEDIKQEDIDIENDQPGSRKNSKKGSKKKKKKNSVEDVSVNVAVVVNNDIVDIPLKTDAENAGASDEKVKDDGSNQSQGKDDLNKKDNDTKTQNEVNDTNKTAEDSNGTNKSNGASNKENATKNTDEIAVLGSDEIDGFTKVTGDDEVDAMSTFSFKEVKDFKYYFQHPYVRLFIAYFVTFCNFLIYAEDPVAHSMKECNIPLVGNDFAFVFKRYPSNAWSLLKVVLWLAAIIVGMIIGKLLVHKLLFCKVCRLKMFTEDQGSWMTMFLVTLLSVFIFSWLYNAFLLAGGDSTEDYRISGLLGLTNSFFMKMAACGTWSGDFLTAWMVTDMMLQEKLYPYWARPVRKWWNRRFNRIILFWVITSLAFFTVVFVIATDYIQWDKLHRDFLSSNELSRAFLASFILVMDILIVVQDWDFPHFVSAIDIKLPGINTAHIKFEIPQFIRPEKWHVHITGKWFNYGILFLVMILDLNMWKNQIFYAPFDYGQYVDSEGKIHSVKDDYSLENHNETLMSFNYRNSTINPLTNQTYISGDTVMNSRYYNHGLAVKCIAFIPALAAFITLGVLVWNFGRFKPTKEDPYAGRLLKRPKGEKKSSFRLFRDSIRKKFTLRNRIKAVPKLLAFTRRNTEKAQSSQSDFPENWRPPTEPA